MNLNRDFRQTVLVPLGKKGLPGGYSDTIDDGNIVEAFFRSTKAPEYMERYNREMLRGLGIELKLDASLKCFDVCVAASPVEHLKAFGLEPVYWGMTAAELEKAVPGVHAIGPAEPGRDARLVKDQQVFFGCKARVDFNLPGGKLADLTLTADADFSTCDINMVAYITSLYGPTYDVIQGNTDVIFKWRGATGLIFTTAAIESLFKGAIEVFDNRPAAAP